MTFIEAALCFLSVLISVMSFDNSKERFFFVTQNFLHFSFPIQCTCISLHFCPCSVPQSCYVMLYFIYSFLAFLLPVRIVLFPPFLYGRIPSPYRLVVLSITTILSYFFPTSLMVKHFFCPFHTFILLCHVYRVSQEECARIREGVPYVKLYRYNPKYLCPKLNGYGDNGQRSLKL